ncbi:MAG: succinylglutamate desuccinylase [Gammaproteobacteria bacterium]|nr:MAG: succinylglutamate desuccinylase [Gammaproteobacteria bacterium]
MPVQVVRGRRPGPCLFVSAALHGDEINGVEIIRRLLNVNALRRLRGSLIAVPVVNVYGFIGHSRYLPDRRDLNRSFPGSERGSMAARLANLFLTEIVAKADYGIDLHTAAIHRDNLPQVRANLNDAGTERLASAFHAPVIINSGLVDGSLRQAASRLGVPVLVYEAGEALRFDELAIRAGVRGILSVMRELAMLPPGRVRKHVVEPFVARASGWLRAPQSGILRAVTHLGARVERGQLLGVVSDPFGEVEEPVQARYDGIVIGRTNLPLVNEGEALFHVARFRRPDEVVDTLESFQQEFDPNLDILPPEEPPLV